MRTRIQKSFAVEADLAQDSVVEVSLVDGKLLVAPVPMVTVTLEELLAAVTEQNLHREVETGPSVGLEVW